MDGITIDGCVHLLLDRDLRLSAFIVLANLLLLALQHLQLGDVEFLGSNHKTLASHAGLQVRMHTRLHLMCTTYEPPLRLWQSRWPFPLPPA